MSFAFERFSKVHRELFDFDLHAAVIQPASINFYFSAILLFHPF